MMNIDQLILWLAKLGFKKMEPAELDFIGPIESDYYMVMNKVDAVLGEITVVDVYFDEDGDYKGGSITFAVCDDEVIKSQFWDDDSGELAVDIHAPTTFESINDLKCHIAQFKFSYSQLQESKNEK